MKITHLAYLGPAGHKTVTGVDFPKDVPVEVSDRMAASILRAWPRSFVGLMICPHCEQIPSAPQKIAEPDPIIEDAPEAFEAPLEEAELVEQDEPGQEGQEEAAEAERAESKKEAKADKKSKKKPGRPRKE